MKVVVIALVEVSAIIPPDSVTALLDITVQNASTKPSLVKHRVRSFYERKGELTKGVLNEKNSLNVNTYPDPVFYYRFHDSLMDEASAHHLAVEVVFCDRYFYKI